MKVSKESEPEVSRTSGSQKGHSRAGLNHISGVIRRPIARLRLMSLRPALVLIRARKPNMRTRLILLTRLG